MPKIYVRQTYRDLPQNKQKKKMQDRSTESNPEFRVGQRVHSAGDPRRTGTVKYVGPIQGYSGAWVGVDWDSGDAKHDGSVNGFRYFRARFDRSGSFVRAHSLSPGISLIEALQLRYRGHSTKEEEGMLWFSFVCLFAERTVEKKGR
jgi:hypothetical protein